MYQIEMSRICHKNIERSSVKASGPIVEKSATQNPRNGFVAAKYANATKTLVIKETCAAPRGPYFGMKYIFRKILMNTAPITIAILLVCLFPVVSIRPNGSAIKRIKTIIANILRIGIASIKLFPP